MPLYKCPHFYFCGEMYFCQLREGTVELQKVQGRMATLINNMEHFPYEESLCRLVFFLLEKNQPRGHMTEISKIMENKRKWVNGEQLLTVSSSTGNGGIK